MQGPKNKIHRICQSVSLSVRLQRKTAFSKSCRENSSLHHEICWQWSDL